MTPSPEEIAAAALHHYQFQLPLHKGKPRAADEWTVYAAILATTTATEDQHDIVVVSCATGTKCTAVKPGTLAADAILHDSHAEVLARRGLVRVLWQEIVSHNDRPNDVAEEHQQQNNGDIVLRRKNSLRELEMLPKYNTSFATQLSLLTQRTFKQQRGERLTATAIILQLAYFFFVRMAI